MVDYIQGIHFDFTKDDDEKKGIGPHIAYTTAEAGGAASGHNDAYLFKSLINDENIEGGSFISNKTQDKPTTMEIKKLDEKVMKAMQEEMDALKMEREELKKQLKSQEVIKSLITYKLSEDISKALSEVMITLEDTSAITDAFDFIAKKTEEDIQKSLEETTDENPLAKMLDEEVGDAGDPGEAVEKTLIEKINEAAAQV